MVKIAKWVQAKIVDESFVERNEDVLKEIEEPRRSVIKSRDGFHIRPFPKNKLAQDLHDSD